jgi:hypothetical protein
LTPPCVSFQYLKYASAPTATERYAEATPESGTVPPIFTSFDETPGSRRVAPAAPEASASAPRTIAMVLKKSPLPVLA